MWNFIAKIALSAVEMVVIKLAGKFVDWVWNKWFGSPTYA